jgi:hypothetical protein
MSEQQARALRAAARAGSNLSIDWENVAEKIEALGRSDRSPLASHVRTIIERLARLEAYPAANPRNGWIDTILRTRENIEDVLKSSPSLRKIVAKVVADEHVAAVRLVGRALAAYGETPNVQLDRLCWSVEQVAGP